MAGLVVLAVIVGALLLLDLAALRWGVDSRPRLGDDRDR
jgi:hypothetical protein